MVDFRPAPLNRCCFDSLCFFLIYIFSICDLQKGETLKEVDINNVSFVAKKTGDDKTFCFFEVDDPRHLKSCHVLALPKGNSDPFGDAVDDAIELREQMEAEQFTRSGSFVDGGGKTRTDSIQYSAGAGSSKFGKLS